MRELQTRSVRVGDLNVHLAEAGEGEPLLLVHGFLVNHQEWLGVLPHLSTRFRCIAPDLPGFGGSDKPANGASAYGWVESARVLAGLLDALGIDKAHVAGHSMGGGVSLVFAADHPSRVRRLSVIDSACYPFPLPFKGRLPLIPGLGPLVFKRLYRRGVFHDYFRNEVWSGHAGMDIEQVDDYYRAFDPMEARNAAYEIFKLTVDPMPVAERVPLVEAETLVLWGNEDRIFSLELGRRLARELKHARLSVLEGCGHAPNEERAEETAKLLAAHFAGS